MKGRKPSAAGKLTSLPPEQRELLIGWLVDENLSYADAMSRVAVEFGVKTSVAALSNFYATQCFARRASEAQEFAESVVNAAKKREDLSEATLTLVQQRAFEHAHARNGDLTALSILAKIMGDNARLELKKRDQDLVERRVQLLEKKAKLLADLESKVKTGNAITPETLAEMQRQAGLL